MGTIPRMDCHVIPRNENHAPTLYQLSTGVIITVRANVIAFECIHAKIGLEVTLSQHKSILNVYKYNIYVGPHTGTRNAIPAEPARTAVHDNVMALTCLCNSI